MTKAEILKLIESRIKTPELDNLFVNRFYNDMEHYSRSEILTLYQAFLYGYFHGLDFQSGD
jgi:hypothetical protein